MPKVRRNVHRRIEQGAEDAGPRQLELVPERGFHPPLGLANGSIRPVN